VSDVDLDRRRPEANRIALACEEISRQKA